MFQDIGVYGTSASQLLELGVSEFCHGIAKGGDCKVVIYNYFVLALILCQI